MVGVALENGQASQLAQGLPATSVFCVVVFLSFFFSVLVLFLVRLKWLSRQYSVAPTSPGHLREAMCATRTTAGQDTVVVMPCGQSRDWPASTKTRFWKWTENQGSILKQNPWFWFCCLIQSPILPLGLAQRGSVTGLKASTTELVANLSLGPNLFSQDPNT